MYVIKSHVDFDTNLNMYKKNKSILKTQSSNWAKLLLSLLGLLFLSECETGEIFLLLIYVNANLSLILYFALKFHKTIARIFFGTSSIFIFSIAVTPAASIVCLIVFQILCHSYAKNVPYWLSVILIILANDVNLNPGPQFHNNFFNFMTWNLNSLAKDDFQRVRLIEAHNSIFNYDLISVCETSLNDSV